MTAAWIAAGLILVLLVIARPFLFTSLDPAVAAARGVPVRLLGPLFLGVVGATAAEATQVVGTLLLFGLLAAPAAAAQRLTARPWTALWLSAGLTVAAMWVGIALAYALPVLPPSFTIMAIAAAEYTLAAHSRRRPCRPVRPLCPHRGCPGLTGGVVAFGTAVRVGRAREEKSRHPPGAVSHGGRDSQTAGPPGPRRQHDSGAGHR